MNRIGRALALILAWSMVLGLCGVAQATEGESNLDATGIEIIGDNNTNTFIEVGGNVNINITVKNNTGDPILIDSVHPGKGKALASLTLVGSEGSVYVAPGATENLTLTGVLRNDANVGSNPQGIIFNYTGNSGATSYSTDKDIIIVKQSEQKDDVQSTPDPEAKLRLSTVDAWGQLVPAPEGDHGEAITLRIPLLCQRSSVYDIKLTPVLSNDVEKFPFDIEAVDYMLTYPNTVQPGNIIEFTYNLRLSEKATTGVKQVDFNLSYRTGRGGDTWGSSAGGELETKTISVFVNVNKGLAPSSGEGEGSGSAPKLIVESYSISSDKIYAGETFDVTITLRNTSSTEDIQNLQIGFKDTEEVAKLVPASGGSNTLYINKIGKGDSITEVLSLQTAPDTEAKAYTLSLEFGYEGASDNKAYTAGETIAIPILQKIRVKFDEPTIYDSEAWVGQSCGMYVRMYNMGKSSLYNCMIDVEGEGLEMEESYFGGNIGSGSTMSADFSIIPSVAGQIEGEVVITYEDVYGEASEERLPFTLTVNEEITFDDPMMGMDGMDGMEVYNPDMEEGGGMPWWAIALIVLALGGLGAGGFILYKKKRARHLEDL